MRSVCLGLLIVGFVGCAEPGPTTFDSVDSGPGGKTDSNTPPVVEEGLCESYAGTETFEASAALELSRLHADVRYFGLEQSNRVVGDALIQALSQSDWEATALNDFALALESVCWISADPETDDTLLNVPPGWLLADPTQPETLSPPHDNSPIILDLRNAGEAQEALAEQYVSRSLFGRLPSMARAVHQRNGLTDEVFSPQGYTADVATLPIDAVELQGTPRTFVVLVGERQTPRLALLALRLRLANLAWIAGEAVETQVAESLVLPLGNHGVAYRYSVLVDEQGLVLPDRIAPDLDISEVGLAEAAIPPVQAEGARRSQPLPRREFGVVQDQPMSPAVARAMLISAHGAIKRFWPYFDALDDETDARLYETLAQSNVESREQARQLLRRFANVIEDGHGWVVDQTPSQINSYLPVVLDHGGVPGETAPVVVRSYLAGFEPGDTLLSFDGASSAEWFADDMQRSFGATPGFRFFNAVQELTTYQVPSTITVRGAAGQTRTQPVNPVPFSQQHDLLVGSTRPHGPLADLGAADIMYLNLDGCHVGGDAELNNSLMQAAQSASGLVLDLRGHPASCGTAWDPYSFLQRLIPMSFSTPQYRVPLWTGPLTPGETRPHERSFEPLRDFVFHGPIVLITDHQAVSFAEDFAMMLVGAERATVVGRSTAGTTGSITGMQLPGQFAFYITGMSARWPDGSVFFGQGVEADVYVQPSAEDFANGIDRFVTTAVATLKN